MSPRKSPGFGINAAGNIVVQENSLMNSGNEVLGTCFSAIEVRAGSPELEAILARVTAEGLPGDCGYFNIRGSGLETMIEARIDECREPIRLSLDKLDDAELGLRCGSDDRTVQALAVGLLGDRIKAGRPGAFAALLAARAAVTDRAGYSLLNNLYDEVVSPVAKSVNQKTFKELTRLANGGSPDPIVSHVAKERLAVLLRRDADLKTIPGIPLADLVASLNSGRYAYHSGVKSAAIRRVRAETVGSGEIAELLSFNLWEVDRFLNKHGMRALGHIDLWRSSADRTRWNRDEVFPAIERTTAYLYQLALREFDGRLPDAEHNQMMLEARDEYVEAYIRFLQEKAHTAEQGSETS